MGAYEYAFGPRLLGGVQFSLINSDIDYSNDSGSSRILTPGIGLYAQGLRGSLKFTGMVQYGRADYENERRFLVGNISGRADADYKGGNLAVTVGASRYYTHGLYEIEPVLTLGYYRSDTDDYRETGAGEWNMAVGENRQEVGSLRAGISVKHPVAGPGDRDGFVKAGISLRRQWELSGDPDLSVRFADGVSTVTVSGRGNDLHEVGLGAEVQLDSVASGALKLGYQFRSASYDGHFELSSDDADHLVWFGYERAF